MGSLTKEEIFAVNDRPLVLVKVPEWDGEVYVKTMSGIERDTFESDYLDAKEKGRVRVNIRATLVAMVTCDENGKKLFSASEAQKLGEEKSGAALDRIFDVAQGVNKISDKDIKELEKN